MAEQSPLCCSQRNTLPARATDASGQALLQERSSRQGQVKAAKQVWEISAKTGTDTFLPKHEGARWVQAGLQEPGGRSPARCGRTGAACATPAQGCSDLAACSLATPFSPNFAASPIVQLCW